MWSRINKNRDHARHTGGHATLESPTGQPVLQTTSGNPLPQKSILKDLPALPIESTQSPSNNRVTSSIYSRDDSGVRFMDGNMPTSPTRNYAEYSRYAEQQEPEISPPDTPVDLSSAQAHSDVSPIDNDRHIFPELPKQRASQLPIPRRNVSNNTPLNVATQSQIGSSNFQANRTNTQGFEGPPDKSSPSRNTTPQDSRSASPQVGMADAKSKEATRLFSAGKEKLQIFAKTREHNKQREAKPPREQWKGASGRFPLVPPIDTKSTAKNGKKPVHVQRDTEDPTREYLNSNSDTYTITTITAGPPPEEKLRSKTGQFRLRARTASPEKKDLPKESERKVEPAVSRKASPVIDVPGIDPGTPRDLRQFSGSRANTPTLDAPNEPNITDMFHDLSLPQEPRSRFSASTYAPTEAATTPPGSSHADFPPMPSLEYSPIMTRRRPIPSSAASIKSMKRKPVSADTPTTPEVDIKNLSPEEQTQRRIDSLEGRRRQLSLRKESIKTMLHELTEVIQPSSIAYDMATRDEVKKTVNSLKNELDDIGKEDHEIGLKLVRLYKNLNNVSEYEQSSLWVKRITS
ncbi:hypothetical protein DPV78_002747 [Talaromyces pinophilus]|nr:hypothetical protein DPV78_002747 [Talaromyces pinophilus]